MCSPQICFLNRHKTEMNKRANAESRRCDRAYQLRHVFGDESSLLHGIVFKRGSIQSFFAFNSAIENA